MIELRGVHKVYGKKQNQFAALHDVTFTIPDGKTVAIVGKSGSGKSTLLHLLGGLDHPTSGEIIINGQNLTKFKRKQMDHFRSHDLGFVFQSFFVEPNQSCYQNVALPLEINDVPRRKRKAMIDRALEQVELPEKRREKARNLSGGQKQRLSIARAIVNNPSVILADEPTGNLDSATGDKIMQLLFDLHKNTGTTLVIVTHDPDLARKCDVRVSIKDGEVTEVTGLIQKRKPGLRADPGKRIIQ